MNSPEHDQVCDAHPDRTTDAEPGDEDLLQELIAAAERRAAPPEPAADPGA